MAWNQDPWGWQGGFGGFGGFGEFGEEEPTYGYAQYLGGINPTSSFHDWLRSSYAPFYQRYLGQYMGAQSRGEQPGTWSDFLKALNPYQEFAYASPRERGESPGSFMGRTRSIF